MHSFIRFSSGKYFLISELAEYDTDLINGIEEICAYAAACPPSGKVRLHLAVADNDGFPIDDIYNKIRYPYLSYFGLQKYQKERRL